MTDVFYGKLSSVISTEKIPEKLDFISSGLNALLDKLYFRELSVNSFDSGSTSIIELDLISFSELLHLNIPGTGLVLTLNPDLEPVAEDAETGYSVLPITILWQWDLLNFISNFKLSSFSFTPKAFYDVILELTQLSDTQILNQLFNSFISEDGDIGEDILPNNGSVLTPDPEPDQTYQEYDPSSLADYTPSIDVVSLDFFVTKLKEVHSTLSITQPLNSDPSVALEDVLSGIEVAGLNIYQVIFEIFILDSTNLDNTFQNLKNVFSNNFKKDLVEEIKDLLIPQISATAQLSAGLEIPRSALIPLNSNNEIIPGDIKTRLIFDAGEFYFDSRAGFGFQETLAISFHPDTPKAQIANTGLIIGFTYAKLDASTTSNIPEADAAGYPVDFVGLYVQHATIEFGKFGQPNPINTSAAIFADDLLIGTGGVSGTIGLEANGKLYRKFGNFAVELDEFSVTFRQNAIINSFITGKITIPKFTASGGGLAEMAIEAAMRDNGDFTIRALPQAGPYTVTFPEVFELKVRSATAGSVDGRYYVSISGQLSFIADIPFLGDILPKDIELTKLLIWDDGRIGFEGGSFKVPKTFRLHIGPVNMEVGNIAFGAYQRKLGGVEREYRYFSFDGMVNTGLAGVNTTGNGIKYYFTVDDLELDHFISIDRLEIDLAIPGNDREKAAFLLNGFLSVSNPTQAGSVGNTEYTGSVAFSLPKLKIAGSAGMRLNPGVPAFVVDVGMDLPNSVPMGGTGLGIYGIRGLIGQHYMPSKEKVGADTWFEYYKAPPEGISIEKFANEPGFSVGAGMSLGTSFDSGFVLSTKLFVMLGLPDVFIIEGQAGMLRHRIALDDDIDPPFSAVIVFGDQSVTGNLSVNYNLPDNGWIFKLQGALDMAFFFNNASGWYLNIGKDQPETERVRAEILTLFKGHAYLMISSRGVKAGAGIRFDFNKSFGPVAVGLGAFLNLGGFVSFKPVQIGAYIQVGGYAYLKVWKFKIGLSIAISLAVEAPRPFNIVGGLDVSIKLLFKRIHFRIELSWRFNDDQSVIRAPQPILQLPETSGGLMPAGAIHILSNESFNINYVVGDNIDVIPAPGQNGWKYNFNDTEDSRLVTIPLDSFIDIELLKTVKPGDVPLGGAANQLPGDYTELIPPQKGVGVQVRHQYEITGLEILSWNNSSWVPYNIYEAVSAILDANTGPGAIALDALKPGYWQFMEPGKFNKIRLLSQNMFSYGANNPIDETALDDKNFGHKDVFCFESVLEEKIINWQAEPLGTTYSTNEPFVINNFSFTPKGDLTAKVAYHEGYAANSLFVEGRTGSLEVVLPQALAYINLQFRKNEHNIKVTFLRTTYSLARRYFTLRVIEVDEPVAILQASKEDASPVLKLENNTIPIDKILIAFNTAVSPDYEGNLIMGSHYHLPDVYAIDGLPPYYRNLEAQKSLAFVTFYNKSFTAAEVSDRNLQNQPGTIAQWPMDSSREIYSNRYAIVSGSPDMTEGYYQKDSNNRLQLHQVYGFAAKADGLIALHTQEMKVENSSFAFELTAIFSPFVRGVSTLLHKVKEDIYSGYKTGYALHLCRGVAASPATVYPDIASVPEYSIWLTCYKETSSWGHKVSDKLTIDCNTSTLSAKQYRNIFINVDRQSAQLEIYIDKLLKASVAIPNELAVFDPLQAQTWLDQLSYVEEEIYSRVVDNDLREERMIEELKVLDDAINKTVQPIWRPDTTFAIKIQTRDVVEGQAIQEKKHVFGFKTAGPVGHFHQSSQRYIDLEAQDRQDEFKLATLKHYIDYERSYPDAQGRSDLGKPVFTQDPQVRLFFTKAYINAMYDSWDAYNGLPEISSSLDMQLIGTNGEVIDRELVWNDPVEIPVTNENLDTLPEDLKALYRLNQSAQQCGSVSLSFAKRIKQGSYSFPDLESNKLYTAVFNAVYQPSGQAESSVEVHKFSFLSSRYPDFVSQAGSLVLNGTPGEESYAVSRYQTNCSALEINDRIKLLINDDTADDPADVLRYAEKYDRLLFGGLKVKNLEPPVRTEIVLFVNTDPADTANRQLLGIQLQSPEPFNNPKYTEELLADTVQLSLMAGGNTLPPASFKYIFSANKSAVFITNDAMNLPVGVMQLKLLYKVFDGKDYSSMGEFYDSPEINLEPYIR